jgi:hypothetical protein
MAITDAYATAAEYRAVAGKSDTAQDAQVLIDLTACSRLFEREAGQFFNKDASVVNRVFRARRSDLLDLTYEGFCPGIASTSGLEIKVDTDGDGSFADETAWASSDYELHPLQAALGPEVKPWTDIKVSPNGTKSFIPGNRVQVTAIFGWPAVPAAVKADVIEMCRLWRVETPRASGRILELEEATATSPLMMSLVSRIRSAYRGKVTL